MLNHLFHLRNKRKLNKTTSICCFTNLSVSGVIEYHECAVWKSRPWCATTTSESGAWIKYGWCDEESCRKTTLDTSTARVSTLTSINREQPDDTSFDYYDRGV